MNANTYDNRTAIARASIINTDALIASDNNTLTLKVAIVTIEDFDNLTAIIRASIANTSARVTNTNTIVDLYDLSNIFISGTFVNIETFIFDSNTFFFNIKESLIAFSLRSLS